MKTYIVKYFDGRECHVKEVTAYDRQDAISQIFCAVQIYWCRTEKEQEEIESNLLKGFY